MIEEWRGALDNKCVVGAVSMDLSKAFEMIPYEQETIALIAFLSAMQRVCRVTVSGLGYRSTFLEKHQKHSMSDHITLESAFFFAEEKVKILSGNCPGIPKGRLKKWLSFRKERQNFVAFVHDYSCCSFVGLFEV